MVQVTSSSGAAALCGPPPSGHPAGEGGYRCPPAHVVALAGLAAALAIAAAGGLAVGGAHATTLACTLLLLIGLPHGALDVELLKRAGTRSSPSVTLLLLTYVGLAAAMLLLWQAAPVLALGAFLLTAIAHFGEDWEQVEQPFLAQGTAVALLCAPALTHHDALASVFASLCGDPRAALVADAMLMLAPIALAVAAATVLRLATLGRQAHAAATLVVLAAMLALPPVIGFALFFCVHHSPRHLGEAWRSLAPVAPSPAMLRWAAAVFTGLALAIAGALFALEPRIDLAARTIAAAFTTLSVLTVPHMALPSIAARLTALAVSKDSDACR